MYVKENRILWTAALALVVLWGLGMLASYTLGGLIHLLLLIAVVMVLVKFFRGRPGW